jgi:hypothetical protein
MTTIKDNGNSVYHTRNDWILNSQTSIEGSQFFGNKKEFYRLKIKISNVKHNPMKL